jgi:hypothetical protein
MTAISVLFGTVSPSWTRISVSVPSNGDGTSALTLSVITSTIGSYLSTWSPGFLSHLPIVPSATLSPSCGIWTLGMLWVSPGVGRQS